MCTIKFVPDWSSDAEDNQSFKGISRKAEVMSLETFKAIALKFKPYINKINMLSLHGCGEPLLDKSLSEKVAFAKKVGFKQIGFTSNCSALTTKKAENLLNAGLNCIIPSIDGITKEVHEEIRPGTDYAKIIQNVKYFISYRDKHDFRCKVLIRMVRQQLNYQQWGDYKDFWKGFLNSSKGDDVLGFDIHNCGGKIDSFEKMKINEFQEKADDFQKNYNESNAGMCPDLFSRLSIFASGDVALCSADQAEYFKLGNVLEMDPIAIFNNERFSHYREKWINKQYMDLEYCKDCTIAISRVSKQGG
jgi:radical SAM protein with 4Fe4S-binding SPASM domain